MALIHLHAGQPQGADRDNQMERRPIFNGSADPVRLNGFRKLSLKSTCSKYKIGNGKEMVERRIMFWPKRCRRRCSFICLLFFYVWIKYREFAQPLWAHSHSPLLAGRIDWSGVGCVPGRAPVLMGSKRDIECAFASVVKCKTCVYKCYF